MRLRRTHIFILALGLALSIFIAWWTVETTEASIDFWLRKEDTFRKGVNSIVINCKNGGQADGDFRLIVEFINASFSNQTEKPYHQIDESTVKCRFLLHEGESHQKRIYFSVNETTETFSIRLSLEKISTFLKENRMYPTMLRYVWNEETKNFYCLD